MSLAGISDFVSVEGLRDGDYGHAKDFGGERHFGVPSDLVIFPREPHSLRREPRHQLELLQWTLYWLDRFVNGNSSALRPNETK